MEKGNVVCILEVWRSCNHRLQQDSAMYAYQALCIIYAGARMKFLQIGQQLTYMRVSYTQSEKYSRQRHHMP